MDQDTKDCIRDILSVIAYDNTARAQGWGGYLLLNNVEKKINLIKEKYDLEKV